MPKSAAKDDMRTAHRIQAAILPSKTPRLPGVTVEVQYWPMTAVAGVFYDFISFKETGGLGVLVSDATGHGVPAALIASMVKVAFSSPIEYAEAPERLLSEMNEALHENIRGQFVTAAFVGVDPAAGRVRASGAGHPFPLLRHKDGMVVELARPGFPLGLYAGADYERIEAPLSAGHRLLICTDGLVELSDLEGEEFGEARLKEFLGTRVDLPAGRFADVLLERLRAWSGRPPSQGFDDDLTLVVADITGDSGEEGGQLDVPL